MRRSVVALGALALFLSGCASGPEPEVVDAAPTVSPSVEETSGEEQEANGLCEEWLSLRAYGDDVDVAEAEYAAIAAAEFGNNPRTIDLVLINARYAADLSVYIAVISGLENAQSTDEEAKSMTDLQSTLDQQFAIATQNGDIPAVEERFPVPDAILVENRNAAEERLTEACRQ